MKKEQLFQFKFQEHMSIKVLYVEDELALAQIVSESLTNRGFEVQTANDGEEALNLFQNSTFDICLLDIMMPKVNGYTVAEQLVKDSPDFPIIFLSAKTQVNDVIKGFNVGARDYMRKPFSMEELIARIHNVLKQKSSPQKNSHQIQLGAYQFIPNRYELYYGDEVIRLSERESSLLSILSNHMNFKILL